ncbi:MAG: 5-bromo-4-chloroindolyl phosphate hydrolysis family protein [Clostridiales bacterium]|jgi:hypothetical protein|nr:5-bromo-4-chloroindolyl phosphate hydrolysis family protein [Clostridiales bacterium]
MREIRHPSAVAYYGAAAVCLAYALFLPMYRLLDYLIFLAAGAVAFGALRAVFPGRVERVKMPVETGDPHIDALLRDGDAAVAEMEGLRDRIANGGAKAKIGAIIDIVGRIFRDLAQDSDNYRHVRPFATIYLPMILKLMKAYARLEDSAGTGENVAGSLERISGALDSIVASCEKQHDALFRKQALDIEVDVAVLGQLLEKDGLLASADGGNK